ncbi:opacity protein-like surface antigen [Roseibium hamelinense]|uniref:Opacity protein-like surface antigen n=2 Tax=Roseibium hamelinense TaxID=150831 RepID=A0A562SNH1_9HYPH|nr:outer membrane protein [Roseibium hamelinense]MTI44955.1 porin family protein [Roseibium hamelinense]TWI82216.1 opacity protein-like surface antigen [Roseibium hamelinense]
MGMFLKRLSLAGVAVVISTAVQAADLPTPVIEYTPEVPAAGGWYLRGDIGYKLYQDPSGSFNDPLIGDLRYERESLDDAWMFGVGVGYQVNDYFRTDLTLDYETKATATGYAPCVGCATAGQFSRETADIDVWTVMLNGYVDIGTWHRITPYVGAGIGAAYVNASSKNSVNPDGSTASYEGDNGQWNFAWALMAGAEYAFTPNWSLDAGYRYKDLGEAKTVRLDNVGTGGTREKWEDLVAHEFRLGMRYTFNGGTAAPAYYPAQPITSNF